MNVLVAVYPRPTVDIVRVLILAMLIGMRASKMAWWLSPSASAGDVEFDLLGGKSSKEGNSNPLQYSCLGNPMDRGAWQATVHGVEKS